MKLSKDQIKQLKKLIPTHLQIYELRLTKGKTDSQPLLWFL